MPEGSSRQPHDDSRTQASIQTRQVIGHVTENLSSPLKSSVRVTDLSPIATPTRAELRLEQMAADFAPIAKYPVRPFAVLSPDQLAAARAQLGPAGFVPAMRSSRNEEDRHPLTPDELRRAREAAR